MDRRTFLRTGSALGLPLIAGCTSGDSPSQVEDDTSSNQDPERAREHLDKAATALEKAGEEIDAESGKFTESSFQGGGVDIKTSTINGYLDTASSEMDKAEEYATNEQKEGIDAVRGYITVIRKAVALLDVFAEGYSQAYSGFTYFQAERYEDAISALESSEATLDDADDLLTVTQSRYKELDTSALSEMDAVELGSAKSAFDDLDNLVPAFQTMAKGMRLFAEGMIDYEQGVTQLDNEQYAAAESSFRGASEDFSSAHAAFMDGENNTPTEIKSTFIELTCYSGALRDASTHFANAMEAYQNGNSSRVDDEIQAASDAANRCDFSSA